MKNILVPTDFSQQSKYALDLARQIAIKTGGTIRLLHIIDHPKRVLLNASGQIDLDDPQENEFVQVQLNKAQGQLDTMLEPITDVALHGEIEIGDPTEDLVRNILVVDPDLVIMGTPGDTEKHGGEHVVKVVRSARCPLITVKSPVQLDELTEILLATNLLEEETEVIDALKELQECLGLPLTVHKVLTANDLPPDDQEKQLMLNFIDRYQLTSATPSFNHAPTEPEGILKYTDEHPGCIIALATHGRKGLAHYISGSVAEDLAVSAHPPVWTCYQRKLKRIKT
ncbi:MAG: universal stress protein [Cyclobacteriaceae bacterium]|nr:universal stress protein [Cyclobacteriaceae bacterium]